MLKDVLPPRGMQIKISWDITIHLLERKNYNTKAFTLQFIGEDVQQLESANIACENAKW